MEIRLLSHPAGVFGVAVYVLYDFSGLFSDVCVLGCTWPLSYLLR